MNSTLPVTVELLIMRTRPRMASALMLLPQPDSPTRPTVSPWLDGEAHAVDGVHGALLAVERHGEIGDVQQAVSRIVDPAYQILSPCLWQAWGPPATGAIEAPGRARRRTRPVCSRAAALAVDIPATMDEIDFAPLDLATRLPFGISRWSHSEFANLVVTMTDEQGLVGFGEGAPNARYHESRDGDALALEELAGALQAVEGPAAVEAFCAAQPGVPALRSALSAAAWDLAGKQAGEPVWRLLGLEQATVRTSLTIPIGDPATMLAQAHAAAAHHEGEVCERVLASPRCRSTATACRAVCRALKASRPDLRSSRSIGGELFTSGARITLAQSAPVARNACIRVHAMVPGPRPRRAVF